MSAQQPITQNMVEQTKQHIKELVGEITQLSRTDMPAEEFYAQIGYDKMLANYQNMLCNMVGPTKVMISSDTLQVSDYSKYNWTMFDPEAKKQRHETVFPTDKEKAFSLGAEITGGIWE